MNDPKDAAVNEAIKVIISEIKKRNASNLEGLIVDMKRHEAWKVQVSMVVAGDKPQTADDKPAADAERQKLINEINASFTEKPKDRSK